MPEGKEPFVKRVINWGIGKATNAGIVPPKIELPHGGRNESLLKEEPEIHITGKELGYPDEIIPIEITWGELATVDDLLPMIELVETRAANAAADGVIDMTDIGDILETFSSDIAPKAIISAATNQYTGQAFYQRLRQNIHSIIQTNAVIREDTDFHWQDIMQISEKWGIPIKLIRWGGDPKEGGHYTLALKDPVQESDGTWKVLIYDPLLNGERWQALPQDWQTSARHGVAVLDNMLVKDDEPYDLTVEGDEKYAEHADIIRAKMARFQFDVTNCGPLCLYAAALRTAFKDGFNQFKYIGREILEKDTRTKNALGELLPGIHIYTREEIYKNKV